MGKKAAAAEVAEVRTFSDATVVGVMVGTQWHPVAAGTWTVDLRGPYMHATWLDGEGVRYSAGVSQVQMVRHRG